MGEKVLHERKFRVSRCVVVVVDVVPGGAAERDSFCFLGIAPLPLNFFNPLYPLPSTPSFSLVMALGDVFSRMSCGMQVHSPQIHIHTHTLLSPPL